MLILMIWEMYKKLKEKNKLLRVKYMKIKKKEYVEFISNNLTEVMNFSKDNLKIILNMDMVD